MQKATQLCEALREKGIRAFGSLLGSQENLEDLYLMNDGILEEAARTVNELISYFRCSSTRIRSKGGFALVESLEDCTSLRRLDLCDDMFGIDARLHLSNTLYALPNLTEVNLSYLNLEDEATKAAAIAFEKSAASSLDSCVASKGLLTKLNLAKNELRDEGTIFVAQTLKAGERKFDLDKEFESMQLISKREGIG